MTSPPLTVLVREREPYWVPELQRQLSGEPGITVRGCSAWSDLDMPSADGHYVVVLNLQDNVGSVLDWFTRRRQHMQPRVITLANPMLAEWEWTFRGLGVTSFITEGITGRELARQCRQWLVATAVPKEPRTK